MKSTFQYAAYPSTEQKLELNQWLRICQYWYNRQLGDRFDWWENHRSPINACPLQCSISAVRDKPNYYNQKRQLPELKKDLVTVEWSGELLDFSRVPANTLQQVGKRADEAFSRFLKGDKNGKRSGRPRFKSQSRYRSMVFEGAGVGLHSCSVGGKWLFVKLPKVGLLKVRVHRPLPNGAVFKRAQLIKKAKGWFINICVEDPTVPTFEPEVDLSWDNALGLDAVLHEEDYLATSEGTKLPSAKWFRKSQQQLAKISGKKSAKQKGSKARRKLAIKEAKLHQRVAAARKDHAYKTAHAVVNMGKQVIFYEKLNLAGLSKRNKAKPDGNGGFLPNGQSSKSGLNKSWADAAFGQFFKILEQVAEKAGSIAIAKNPAYTSQLLAYRDEFVFTDCGIRGYWDEAEQLWVDRDINAAINLKRVGLDEFPTIKRRRGNPVVSKSTTNSTSKEVLATLRGLKKPALYA